jgi:hypothetical protein
VGVLDDVAVGKPDRLVASADPGVAVVWFAEHVEQVVAGSRVAYPGLMYGRQRVRRGVLPDSATADRVEDISGEAVADLGEARGGYADLDVAVHARLRAAEQVQRPARGHVPRRGDPGQVVCDVVRGPAG